MNQVIAIGGVPASGKTTLVKRMKAHWDKIERPKLAQFKSLKGYYYPSQNVYVLGLYEDGEKFAGTDMLQMAVQPDAERFIQLLADKGAENWTVVFEGDRLFNSKFLRVCEDWADELLVVILHATPNDLKLRHFMRDDTQTETWLKGRVTKVKNVAAEFNYCTYLVKHENPTHTVQIADALIRYGNVHCSLLEKALRSLLTTKPACQPMDETTHEELPL